MIRWRNIGFALWLSSPYALAVVSDPSEIVERAHAPGRPAVGVPPIAAPVSTPTPNVAQQPRDLQSRVVEVAAQVKSWWNSQVKGVFQAEPKKASEVAKSNPTPTAVPSQASEAQPVAPVANITPSTFAVDVPKSAGPALTELKATKEDLKAEGLVRVAKPGRKGQDNLSRSKSGVPVFAKIDKVKALPRLDVGEEPTVMKRDFLVKNIPLLTAPAQDIKPLSTPSLIGESEIREKIAKFEGVAEKAKDLNRGEFGLDKIVTKESVDKIQLKPKELVAIVEKPYREMGEAELQLLTALIMYNKGENCPAILGMLNGLSKDEKFGTEANFMLGKCASHLKLNHLAFEKLSTIAKDKNHEFTTDALQILVSGISVEQEGAFGRLVRDLGDSKLIPTKNQDEVYFVAAKGLFRDGDYASAKTFAEKVPESSKRFAQANFLVGLSLYSLNQIPKAMAKLEELRNWMNKSGKMDKSLNSLAAINLARMRFTQGQAKEALSLYQSIDKDQPMWVQGLIEQGWVQLAMDDFAGAIGNMYSLHSPYFRAVYKPESFVVRTIGYLNICQYGDAYRTLSWLEHEYRPWGDKTKAYLEQKRSALDIYELTKTYLKGKSDQDVAGLPPQVLREMARQKEFLNLQGALNDLSDEFGRYDAVDGMILSVRSKLKNREQKAVARFKDLKAKLKRAETDKTLVQNIDQWRQQSHLEREVVISLRYQMDILDQSRKSYASLREATLAKLEKDRRGMKESAGKVLLTALNRVNGEINRVLENNEFLRYETFAGSGENIRYQVAGGKTSETNRVPANMKPTKMLNWAFDGEYWEDEIGSYRSSLRNNCPNSAKMEGFFKNRQADGSQAPSGKGE